jgi:hypothetical protein
MIRGYVKHTMSLQSRALAAVIAALPPDELNALMADLTDIVVSADAEKYTVTISNPLTGSVKFEGEDT